MSDPRIDGVRPDLAAQYEMTRRAVEDALWNVVETMVYAAVVVVLGVVGVQLAVASATTGSASDLASLLPMAFGLILATVVGLELARTFDVWPFR